MCFDDKGNKTNVPDKERQIEAFQLLFMLLPPANRSLLKLLLDLLYHTARNQHVNKMSAINLAKMFAPHIIWPKNARSLNLFPHWNYPLSVCGQVNLDAVIFLNNVLILHLYSIAGDGKWSSGKPRETE